jgi:hypothetical protein
VICVLFFLASALVGIFQEFCACLGWSDGWPDHRIGTKNRRVTWLQPDALQASFVCIFQKIMHKDSSSYQLLTVSQGFFLVSVIDCVSHLIINKSKYSNQGLFCTGRLDSFISFIHHHQKKKKNNNSCLLLGQVTQVVLPSLAAFRLFGLWSPSPPLLHTIQ